MAEKLNSLKQPREFLPPTSQFGVQKSRKSNAHVSEEGNFLMINGTKIFYDDSTIGGIVDIGKRRNIL
jgi:hypothetical protein